jgi:hypothetical protein
MLELLDSNPSVVPPERAEEFVKVRQERQARIDEEGGARFAAVIWEPALIAPMALVETHLEQLDHLLEVGKRRNVILQVLPLANRKAASVSGPFVGLSFDADPQIEVVTSEGLTRTWVLEEPSEITGYAYAFEALSAAALGPDGSAAFIRDLRDRIREEAK